MLEGITVNAQTVADGSIMSYLISGVLMLKLILPFVLMFFLFKFMFGKSSEDKAKEKSDIKADAVMLNKYNTKRRY